MTITAPLQPTIPYDPRAPHDVLDACHLPGWCRYCKHPTRSTWYRPIRGRRRHDVCDEHRAWLDRIESLPDITGIRPKPRSLPWTPV